jgi:putative DNA primase/helicase
LSESNHENVLDQLTAYGLEVTELELDRIKRVKAPGDRRTQKSGWYKIHQIITEKGDQLYVGTYGNWKDGAGTHKIDLKGHTISPEEKAAINKRMADNKKQADAERKQKAKKAAYQAQRMFSRCSEEGQSPYLAAKGVKWYPGVRFSPNNALVLPMYGARKTIVGLQIIHGAEKIVSKKGRNKDFWPFGLEKKGSYFLLGGIPTWCCLVAEGYATAASLHDATNLPVAVVWDAGNIPPAVQTLHDTYKNTRILICADDDINNVGVTHASRGAMAVNGSYVVPEWATPKAEGQKGPTDFNDLAKIEGIEQVRHQLESKIDTLGWRTRAAAEPPIAGDLSQGGGESLKPLLTIDECCQRFSMIYGAKSAFFDHQERILVPKQDVLDIAPDHTWREWKERPDRKVVRTTEVGFDPGYSDKNIKCNLWGGWPTKSQKGNCTVILELLEYLCSSETDAQKTYEWVLKWLAYPIQHPGAKMKTALVFHGGQGTGKNLFFETYMHIFGEYGKIVDQSAIEDKFNEWVSKKLFLIADEVIARQELYHVKNKLKGMVTGDWIHINPKNLTAYEERNHVNVVFLSNENQPLVLERDDRRYTVIRTPEKLGGDFYQEVWEEVKAGGIAALHDHLLNIELGDFNTHTKPPQTKAKMDLIHLGLDSSERFLTDWQDGYMDLPFCPCISNDLYRIYSRWCKENGVFRPRESKDFLGQFNHQPGWDKKRPRVHDNLSKDSPPKQKTVIIPPIDIIESGHQRKSDETDSEWLTRTTVQFHTKISNFGRAYDDAA